MHALLALLAFLHLAAYLDATMKVTEIIRSGLHLCEHYLI